MEGCKTPQAGSSMSTQFSSAFVDLSLDCRPDLFLETATSDGKRVAEIYYYVGGTSPFCLVDSNEVPANFGHVSFTDSTDKGTIDAIMMDEDLNVKVFRNKASLDIDSLCKARGVQTLPFEPFTSATMN